MPLSLHRNTIARRGVSLTEVVIAIGVIGLIIGVIWGAVSRTYENLKINQAEKNFTTLAQNLELMAISLDTTLSQGQIIGNGYYYAGAVNSVMVDSGAVPTDMFDPVSKAIFNPWQQLVNGYNNAVILTVGTYVASAGFSIPAGATGTFGAPIPPAGSPVNAFEVLYNGIPSSACIKLVTFMTGLNRDPNIVTVFINDWSAGSGIQTFPVTPSMAEAKCASQSNNMAGPAAGGGNLLDGTSSVDIVYKYR